MSYTDAQRSEILQRGKAGESEQDIARAMNINPFGVKSVLRWQRVRDGLEPDPLEGKRGRRPKEDQGVAVGADGTPNIRIQVGPPRSSSAAQRGAPTVEGVPLFVGSAVRIEVHRLRADPPSAGVGYLDDEDGLATLSQLKARFGGGLYELRAYDGNGRALGRRRETLSGPSVPAAPEEAASSAYWPVASTGTSDRIFDVMERERLAEERRRREDREREERRAEQERERARIDAERQERWLAAQMQMQQAQTAAQMQMMTTMLTAAMGQGGGNKLTDMISALSAMKDLVGDGGSDDPTTSLISAAPKMLESIKDLARMKMGAVPAQLGPGEAVPVEKAAASIHAKLVSEGMSPDEATAELGKVYGYLDNKIIAAKRKAQTSAAARRSPSTPAPSGTNGQPGPVTAVPAAPNPDQAAKA